jgi:hypothetical protein
MQAKLVLSKGNSAGRSRCIQTAAQVPRLLKEFYEEKQRQVQTPAVAVDAIAETGAAEDAESV